MQPFLPDFAPYAAARYTLIPLHHWNHLDPRSGRERGKSPRDLDWTRRPYDPAEVLAWAASGGNVGVRLQATDLVVDYDPRNSEGRGVAVLVDLELAYGVRLDRCPRVNTGSGGAHYYLRLPEGVRVRNGLPEFPGVEFKSGGRQVVAAGSVHPCGRRYEWDDFAPGLGAIPMTPPELVAAIRKSDLQPAGQAEGRLEERHVLHCLRQLDPEKYKEHDRWLELMMAVHYASGGDPEVREAFAAWSTSDPEYAGHEPIIRTRWDSLRADVDGPAVGVGTLFKHVADAGGSPHLPGSEVFDRVELLEPYVPAFDRDRGGKPKPSYGNALEGVLALGLQPTFDVFPQRYGLRSLGVLAEYFPSLPTEVDSALVSAARYALRTRYGLEVGREPLEDAINALGQMARFDSLVDHVGAFEWDGVERLSTWPLRYTQAEPTAYVRAVGRLFLLGMAARALSPGVMFQSMPILEGPQGSGKSSLLRAFGGPFFQEGLPHTLDEDAIISLEGKWVVEVEELATFSRADVESLKAFITRQVDRVRPKYAKKAENRPRRFVLAGTTNEAAYLTDTTGNRRFLPVCLGIIDFEEVAKDREVLLAEAVRLWNLNPDPIALELPVALRAAANEEQEARRIVDPWEDAITVCLEKMSGEEWISSENLLWEALQRRPSNAGGGDSRRVSRIMQKLGWRRSRGNVDGHRMNGFRRGGT